ncbi:MAG: serine/threonine protein kinase [Deltaproteobacteria bacterium]|nr:serine/threonine protein kinase [Deltaproteobacteria bacterium]
MGEPKSGLDDTIPASSPPEGAEESAPPAQERYRLGAELGRGGMGRVVEAFDTLLGRTVAFKEVLPGAAGGLARRFRREVEITARLEHPSIVPLYDAGTTADGRAYYVMRRVTGQPLDQLIGKTRSLGDRMALLPNLLAACEAIAHAHKRGVIHRDLKPGNILVGELGETVVIDWGLAKVIGEKDHPSNQPTVPSSADSLQTQMGSVFGTPGFMAPEQARGEELDTAGDVFALGACLYHLLAGRPPVKGTSATEVIASTLKHEIKPLRDVADGVPAELAAIVAKALAYEAKQRYANAGELAEDLRRYTTGQLVAAHDYTRVQRLVRFARRNRAPLSVAALALAGVAAVSWIGVRSVMKERDIANAARAEAIANANQAQKQAAELAKRADQLIIARARTLVDANPTRAIIALKQLSPSSALLPDAQALAKAAQLRGVAWGLPALPGFTVRLELSHDGRRLLQVTREGQLQIGDLDARRIVHTHSFGTGITAGFVDGDRRILVAPDHKPPQIYDPATAQSVIIDSAGWRDWAATDSGTQIAFIDTSDNAGIYDVATNKARTLATGKLGGEIAIAPDGGWLAFEDKDALVVIDRDGKPLARHEGRAASFVVSTAGKLAVISNNTVLETKAPWTTWTTVPVPPQSFVHLLAYRGELLDMFATEAILTWNGARVWSGIPLRGGVLWGFAAADGLSVATTSDGRVHVVGNAVAADLVLPSSPDEMIRVAARKGVSRFATTCGPSLCVWNIDDVVPKQVAGGHPGFFVDDHRVISNENMIDDWKWIDLDTGADGKLAAAPLGLPQSFDLARDGRLLILLGAGEPTSTAVIYSPDLGHDHTVPGLAGPARLIDGGGFVASAGKGRIVGQVGTEPVHQLLTVDGEVAGIAELGPLHYAVLTAKGELVRAKLDGNDLVRLRVQVEPGAFVVGDRQHRAVIASGKRLLRWDQDVHEIAQLPHAIESMTALDAGILATTDQGEMYLVGDSGVHRVPVAAGRDTRVADRGQAVFSMTGGQISVVELPAMTSWTLPKVVSGFGDYAVSPDGHRVVEATGGGFAMWDLPRAGADFGAWLDELTNATEDDGILSWPWQSHGP